MTAEYVQMLPNESRPSSLPTTEEDISRLMRTATDAVNDLGHSVPVTSVKEKITELKLSTRDYVVQYPLRTLGAALAVGFLLGYICRVSSEGRK